MSSILRFTLGALLLATILLSSGPEVQAAGELGQPSLEVLLQQLGGRPCPDGSEFTCVTLDMPLDHFNPADGRTIPVTFAVLPATGDRQGMFVTATGGPGTSGIAVADYYTSALDPEIPARFDIVFFDQRGVALSGGLACPQAAANFYQADWRAQTAGQEAALKRAARQFSRACVAELDNPRILPYLGTAQAVEDLERFRQIVGDSRLWLYGESYGTQLAQTYAARHGEHLAALLLDGAVDLTLDGFEFYTGQAQAFNDTLVATLSACDDEPACRADLGGDALLAYDRLAALLDRRPLPFRFPLPQGGFARRQFTFADLETTAAGQMYNEDDRMLFSRALAAFASRQDLAPLARLLYLSLGLDPQTLAVIPDPSYSDAIFYAVECQDYGYPGRTPQRKAENYLRAGDPVETSVPRLASIFYGDLPCSYWPRATPELDRPRPLVAEGIPTIVLGATADPATPVENGIDIYHRLDDGFLITQQGGPHVIFGRGNECPDAIVTGFLARGEAPPQREMECEGVVADEYIPLAPAGAGAFEDPVEALASAETEIYYLPDFYYWDGIEPASAGCTFGGVLEFATDGPLYTFNLARCALTRNFLLTGDGNYDPDQDRFVLEVVTTGRWNCELEYVRAGEETRVHGRCNGKPLEGED
jgi:pimeloyl-ACP methyl ester carboxylesterase